MFFPSQTGPAVPPSSQCTSGKQEEAYDKLLCGPSSSQGHPFFCYLRQLPLGFEGVSFTPLKLAPPFYPRG